MLGRMTLATVQHQLSTPEGFAKAVDAKRTVGTLGWTSLVLGAAAFGINLFSTGQAVDWNWNLVGMTLFRPDLFEYSNGRSQVWSYVYTFAPFILIPLGIILLIVHFSTRKNAGSTLFADFQSRGWVGKQRYTGLQVKNGNQTVDTVLVSHPSIPDEQFDAIALQFQTYVTSLDKKALKAFTASATKAGVLTGIPAAVIAPGVPAEVVIAPTQGKSEFAVVVPPAPGTTAKFKVLPIKS
jgi:hypothetical protein